MELPKFTYQSRQLYDSEQARRVSSVEIEAGEVYTAMSLLENNLSQHDAVSFPITFKEAFKPTEPLDRNPLGIIAMRMVVLTPDWRPSKLEPIRGVIIHNGIWATTQPIPHKLHPNSIKRGYLLTSLPDELVIGSHAQTQQAETHQEE